MGRAVVAGIDNREAEHFLLSDSAEDIITVSNLSTDAYELLSAQTDGQLAALDIQRMYLCRQNDDEKLNVVCFAIEPGSFLETQTIEGTSLLECDAEYPIGAKFDLSLDSEGYGRIEKISFEAYNESTSLIEAVERFKERTGCYPKRVLADRIYRTRENRNYCKEHGIRLSGSKPGRPGANAKADKKQEYQDNADRIEVERTFSLSKRCYGMDCIAAKLEETQLTSIALSVFVTNLFKIQKRILLAFLPLFRFWDGLIRSRNLESQTVA